MCEPSLIMAGVGVATAAMSASQQATEAQSAKAYQEAMISRSAQQQALNERLAKESYGRQANAANAQLAQDDANATEQMLQANIRAARAIAEAKVDATAAGVTGTSISGLYDEYAREN